MDLQPVDHPAAWCGDALFQREDFDLQLDADDVDELHAAIERTAGRDLDQLTAEVFACSRLAPRLQAVQRSLEHGSGATRIRGISLEGLDDDRIARLFWGLAHHIGTPVSQSASGERLLHVRDQGFAPDDPRFRGPHSNRQLAFHTDRCDVIAFCCVRPAATGGDNHLISSITLYNELLARHPDAVRVLQQSFPYLRHTVDAGNQHPYTMVPVFSAHQGHFAASLLRVLIDRADRTPGVPDLSAEQRDALDTLESVAKDSALQARFRLGAGDILLLNNWVTMHRRTGFEDHAEPERQRHLMRLWLAVPNSRPLDPRLAEHFGATRAGALRGGMQARSR